MARRRTGDVAVGAMFALALVIVALAVMAVGGDSRLFSNTATYVVHFPNAIGLVEGSPVKIAGVQVGSVSGIRLSTDPSQRGIEVEVSVDRAFAPRVREDSRAALGILQMLSGEKFVKITPGSADLPQLADGAEILTQQDPALIEQATVAAENINEITVSLKNILSALERGEGLIGQMINDPEFGREGLAALRATLENTQALSADLRRGRGLVGRLLYDETVAARLDDIGSAVESLTRLVAGLDLERGAVGALLEEDGPGERALLDLRDAAGSFRELGQCLAAENGLLERMVCDPEFSQELAADLRRATRNLAEITDKINRGEGTLGALLNDRTLYDGMEDVLAGVHDSKFARWLLRHYRKKGIKGRPAPGAAPEPDREEP